MQEYMIYVLFGAPIGVMFFDPKFHSDYMKWKIYYDDLYPNTGIVRTKINYSQESIDEVSKYYKERGKPVIWNKPFVPGVKEELVN